MSWSSWSTGRRIGVVAAVAVGVAAVAGGVVLAFSGGGGDQQVARPTTTTTASTTTTTAPPLAPLTGLPDPMQVSLHRPALSVKIENTPEARPQSGLAQADVVYEEVVEGGITRFWAVFSSSAPDTVGPIRSVRLMDPGVISPIGGVAAFSGGTPDNVALVRACPVTWVDESNAGDAFYRSTDRYAPHNLYGYTDKLFARGGQPVPPRPLFTYLAKGATFGGERVDSFHVGLSPGYDPTYTYDPAAHTWKRSYGDTAFNDVNGTQVAPTNVIVQFVNYPAGSEGQLIGSGDAWVFSDGQLIKGRWSKPDDVTPTSFTNAFGGPIPLTAGHTWVELAPLNTVVDVALAPPPPPTTLAPTTTTVKKKAK